MLGNEPLKDPSTAWQTAAGEWRLTTAGGSIYHSWNFRDWSQVPPPAGSKHLFAGGECPSFFPLPPLVPGRACPAAADLPTHVFKYSHDGSRDYVVLGNYEEGPANTSGTWRVLDNASSSTARGRVVDNGAFYASKDFAAPGGRRLLYGWARVPGTLSLPGLIGRL